jgi:hypothetical protein
MITYFSVGSAIEIKDFIHYVLFSIRKKDCRTRIWSRKGFANCYDWELIKPLKTSHIYLISGNSSCAQIIFASGKVVVIPGSASANQNQCAKGRIRVSYHARRCNVHVASASPQNLRYGHFCLWRIVISHLPSWSILSIDFPRHRADNNVKQILPSRT